MSDLNILETNTFDENIANGVSLIDFHADWCAPCRMMTPIVEEIADDFNGKVKVFKLDVDASQEIAAKLGVTSIPTMIIFKDGKEVTRTIGVTAKEDIEKLLNSAL